MQFIKLTIFGSLFILNFSVFSQNKIENTEWIVDFFGEPPEFHGGDSELYKFIDEKRIYPQNWRKDSINGRVYIKFLVDSCGQIRNPKIIRGLNPILDSIAINIIREMPKWHPAKQNGKSISLDFYLPIRFGKMPEIKKNKK